MHPALALSTFLLFLGSPGGFAAAPDARPLPALPSDVGGGARVEIMMAPGTDASATRLECFLLTAPPAPDAAASARPLELGLCAWRRSGEEDELQLELEIIWFPSAPRGPVHRVLHVERLTAEGPRLVWREFGAGPGRCLLAEWAQGGAGLVTIDWSTGECVRGAIDTAEGAVFPLYLLELVRSGQAVAGPLPRFDPLSRSLEPVSVRTSYETPEDAAAAGLDARGGVLRSVELVRADGSLATRCRFAGTELEAFQWQEDGARARRIPPAEYERRLAAIDPGAAHERP